MRPPSLTQRAHAALLEVLRPGDRAIDATAGNGGDTLFLATAVGPTGHVWAFDTQAAALARTRERLAAAGIDHVELRQECHSRLAAWDPTATGPVRAVMFNLGYLPGGDHALVTRPETTRVALDAAARLLTPGGRISVVVYRGHPGGQAESATVEEWLQILDADRFAIRRETGAAPAAGSAETTPWLVIVERQP